MSKLWKKSLRRPQAAATTLPTATSPDPDEGSPDELRRVIDELERALAEQEATNAFLRDLLTERWFDSEADRHGDTRELERL